MNDFFIVIPTRERLEMLSNLLNNLNAFSTHISKVVIVDQSSASIDEKIKSLTLNFPFEIIKNDASKSVNHSRNLALSKYNNEKWLFFLDDDISIPKESFYQIIEILKPNIIDVLIPGIHFSTMEKEVKYDTMLDTISKPNNFSKPRFRLQVCSGLNITKSEVFKNAGFFFDENFSIWGDDLDFGMRLMQAGANIYFEPKIKTLHHNSPQGGQRDKAKNLNLELEKQKLYYYFLNKHFSKNVVKREYLMNLIVALKNGNLNSFLLHIKAKNRAKKIMI